MQNKVDVREATHVKTQDGKIHRITEKWGIRPEGGFAKPSEGGFGCIIEDGRRVTMYEALEYLREEE